MLSRSKISAGLRNLALFLTSILTLFVLLEFVIFRILFLPSDLPLIQETGSTNSVLKFVPNQLGVYRKHQEINAEFRINQNGWNSRHDHYRQEKQEGETRICLIGDSYIEALQVPFGESVAEKLEDELGNPLTTVYRLGISGAPLSQYLFMLKNEALGYHPDIVILNLVHNDFEESISGTGGSYDIGFAKYGYNNSGVLKPMPPGVYKRNFAWWIKKSALYRYLRVRKELRIEPLKNAWMELTSEVEQHHQENYVANIDWDKSSESRIRDVIDFGFRELRRIADEAKFRPIILVDGDRSAIASYVATGDNSKVETRSINELVVSIGRRYGLEAIDLWPILEKYHRETRQKLTFDSDGHWPAHVHNLVAVTLAKYLNSDAQ